MVDLFWSKFQNQFHSLKAFLLAFDWFEVLVALAYSCPEIEQNKNNIWTLPGAYVWRRENQVRILSELRAGIEKYGSNDPYVQAGLVGNTAADALRNLENLEEFISQLHWY